LKDVLEPSDDFPNQKAYSVTEEVSKSGYFWTVLHYSSHYGKFEVLEYLIELMGFNTDKFDIYNMQTIEGKTPLMCAISSKEIDKNQKQRIVKLWFDTNCIDFKLRKKTG
jgi:ankyrin repeat protein